MGVFGYSLDRQFTSTSIKTTGRKLDAFRILTILTIPLPESRVTTVILSAFIQGELEVGRNLNLALEQK